MANKIACVMLTLLLLGGCKFANTIKMRFANDDLYPMWPKDVDTASLSVKYISDKPHVFVSLNGEDSFLFLIDTGASLTYLMDSPKVANLDYEKGAELAVGGWGDEENSQAFQTKVHTLSLAGVNFKEVSMAYLPVSTSPYFLRSDEVVIDGVLGHDILRHFVWHFDQQNNHIAISRKAYQPREGDVKIDFKISMSKLAIPVQVDLGQSRVIDHDILIDTGSRHYFKMSQTYLEEEEISLGLQAVQAADFGLSGRALHQRVTLPGLQIGDLKLENIKTNLIVTEDADEFWVIGSAALNQFVSIIDYQQNKLFLSPYKNQVFTSRYNLLGLELRKIASGEFVVRYVMPQMASAVHDIKVGDLIVAANGKSAVNMSENDWLTMSATPGTYEICRTRENEQVPLCVDIKSQHITGYSISFE